MSGCILKTKLIGTSNDKSQFLMLPVLFFLSFLCPFDILGTSFTSPQRSETNFLTVISEKLYPSLKPSTGRGEECGIFTPFLTWWSDMQIIRQVTAARVGHSAGAGGVVCAHSLPPSLKTKQLCQGAGSSFSLPSAKKSLHPADV